MSEYGRTPRSALLAFSTALWLTTAISAGAQTCSGCSCRGGPGFRLPAGECASWKVNERFCDGTCYPAGTKDERPNGAPSPPIRKPAKP